MRVKRIKAREILDSRGIPTIETYVELDTGAKALGMVPSGASTGATEVLELRDGDQTRYFGKGVLKAISKINNEIADAVIGMEFETQKELDQFLIDLDGTDLKTRLGGNSILSVSMAFCRATAREKNIELYEYFAQQYWGENYDGRKLELPQPMILIMEGGAHGNWSTDFQEYMIVPKKEKFPVFAEALRAGAEIFKSAHDILNEKGYSVGVGFEGAYSPIQVKSNHEALEIILFAIDKAGYKVHDEISIALDVASSEFYDSETKKYTLKKENLSLTSEEWVRKQMLLYSTYPIWSIEDGCDQEDWQGWKDMMREIGDSRQIVGDDLLTTNPKRIQKAIDLKAANSVLVKINQIGSITETLDAIKLAESAGMESIISHRGGETNDSLIADLVVGTSASQCKFGGPDRGERLAKYNRLTAIEEKLFKL